MFTRHTPEELPEEDTNLTDTNGAPSSMDEDGELEAPEEDTSPPIHSLSMKFYHKPGGIAQTEIVATLHTAQGISSKRLVVPGGVTAKQLAAHVLSVGGW